MYRCDTTTCYTSYDGQAVASYELCCTTYDAHVDYVLMMHRVALYVAQVVIVLHGAQIVMHRVTLYIAQIMMHV